MKKTLVQFFFWFFFWRGEYFALSSQVKEGKETFSLVKVQSGIAFLFELQVQILQIAVRRREGKKTIFLPLVQNPAIMRQS